MGRIVLIVSAVLPLVLPAVGSFSAIRKGGAKPWTPLDLGSKLIAWWDASQGITLAGSQVASWADRKNGYSAAQARSSARPQWSATAFNGAPCLIADGSDDCLVFANPPFPTGANGGELWAVASQDALAADGVVRHLFGYGNFSATRRAIIRAVSGGNNRTGGQIGNGVTTFTSSPNTDFSSRHVVRVLVTPTDVTATLDGTTSGSAVAVVPATTTERLVVGATSASSPANFWQGKIRDVIITAPLTTDEATKLQTFLLARRAL